MKIILLILLSFTVSSVVLPQAKLDDIRFKMKGVWKRQGLTKEKHFLNKIIFSSDTTGIWSVDGIICDCEFFKIYQEESKVYIKRLIILNGWSDPIEIVSVDIRRLTVRYLDGETRQYIRVKYKNFKN